MTGAISMLKPSASNPATSPVLSDVLVASVNAKTTEIVSLLKDAVQELKTVTFANSFGAEDMVLTDIILKNQLAISIFSLDTGRLPVETYDLIAETEKHYNTKLDVYFPKSETVEFYVKNHGINAFYETIDLRKSCCHMRKVEPLQRALKNKAGWVTGMRAAQATTRTSLPVREFEDRKSVV